VTLVIDGHVHAWPDAIAPLALAHASAELPRFGDGTVDSLLETMAAAGVDRAACFAVADTANHVDAANRFVGSLGRPELIPVGTIHPGLSAEENRSSLASAGARAVKLHPLFQGYDLDDRRLWDVLDMLQGELPVIMHVGDGGEHQRGTGCTPWMVRDLAHRFPRLEIVACHFGGYRRLDEAEELLVGLPIFLDTSWPPGLGALDAQRVRGIIERHGADRVIFGSDWPMADPAAEIETIVGLALPPSETEAILGGTLGRLLEVET
jgi:hypothetical protein